MMLSWLSKTLSGLLVLVLTSMTISLVAGQTVFSSHYLESQLQKEDGYNRLSAALSSQLSEQAGFTGNTAVTSQLQTILTPDVLKQQINSGLDQLQAYYRGDGPQATIDLTGVVAQAQAAGIPVPEDSGITKPIVLGSKDQTNTLGKNFEQVKLGSIVASAVLAALLLLVCWRRHSYVALPGVVISTGVLVGLLATALALIPGVITHVVKLNLDSNAFLSVGDDLIMGVMKDLGKRLGIIATVYLVTGIIARVVVGRLQTKKVANLMQNSRPGVVNN